MNKLGLEVFRHARSNCHMLNIRKSGAHEDTGKMKKEIFNIISALRPERTVNLGKRLKQVKYCESKGQFKRTLRKEMLRRNYRQQASFLSRYILGQKIYKERKGIIDDI